MMTPDDLFVHEWREREREREKEREKERGVMGADARDTSERAGERERDSVIAAEAEAGGDAERTRQTDREKERERGATEAAEGKRLEQENER